MRRLCLQTSSTGGGKEDGATAGLSDADWVCGFYFSKDPTNGI